MIPEAILYNMKYRYICKDVYIRVENNSSLFTSGLSQGTVLKMPVSHGEGNYYIADEGLRSLEENNQIAFRYSDAEGNITDDATFNGSLSSISRVTNVERNALGMMPHPERAMEELLGSTDGALFFESILNELSVA